MGSPRFSISAMSAGVISQSRSRWRAACEQVAAPLRDGRDPGRSERAGRLQGEQVLLLRRVELRAVDLREDLALRHELAREVGRDVLDEAFVARVDVVDPPLVGRDAPGRPNGRLEGRPLHLDRLQAQQLLLLGVDRDRGEALGPLRGRVDLVRVDRDEVHPHRVLLRGGRRLLRIHRRPVKEDLAFPAASSATGACGPLPRSGRASCRRSGSRPGRP